MCIDVQKGLERKEISRLSYFNVALYKDSKFDVYLKFDTRLYVLCINLANANCLASNVRKLMTWTRLI